MQRKPGLFCLLWKSCRPKHSCFVYAHFCPSLALTQNESSPFHLLCQLLATHPYTLSHSQPIYCNPEDEGSITLWNTGIHQYDYTTSQSRRVKQFQNVPKKINNWQNLPQTKQWYIVLTTAVTQPIHTHN